MLFLLEERALDRYDQRPVSAGPVRGTLALQELRPYRLFDNQA